MTDTKTAWTLSALFTTGMIATGFMIWERERSWHATKRILVSKTTAAKPTNSASPNPYAGMQWQPSDHFYDEHWIFGHKERGVVRRGIAEVALDEEFSNQWVWVVYGCRELIGERQGLAANRTKAIEAAEKAMGIFP